jgi:hypothetical protein
MQIVVAAVPAQEAITRDNVTMKVDAVVYYPAALQLRLLQTVVEVAAEKNSTLVMPFPVELLRFFDRTAQPGAQARPPADEAETTDSLGVEEDRRRYGRGRGRGNWPTAPDRLGECESTRAAGEGGPIDR